MSGLLKWVKDQARVLVIYGGGAIATLFMLLALSLYLGSKADVTSEAFVVEIFPSLAQKWSTAAVKQIATPELINSIEENSEEYSRAFDIFNALGEFIAFENMQGGSLYRVNIGGENEVTASYQAQVFFKNGRGILSLCMRKIDDTWKLNCISIHNIEGKLSSI